MDVEDQIEDNGDSSHDDAEPDDVPCSIEPVVLASPVKVLWLGAIGKHLEVLLAPVHARHDQVCIASRIALGPVNHGLEIVDSWFQAWSRWTFEIGSGMCGPRGTG